MKTYLKNNGSKDLIVFFCGWAMDETPFEILQSDRYDILFVFDYSDLELDFEFSRYEKKILIAFSYGVFIASLVKDKLPKFDYKIAVNGTLVPIGREFGIPEKIFDMTLNSINEESLKKFYSKMFDNNLDDEYFSENLPKRNPQECKFELAQIKKYFEQNKNQSLNFDKVLISSFDKIFPTKSQLNFWHDPNCKKIESGHFLFYKFNSFSEIINL